ncbi:PTS sugar transporter subunit IIA [Companilactobacillus sp. DQM5]|uniref:PTS sugar transporter subunit IIA n=1 Tax=Companilactobacillus sp. DQM5 TaxID=3463359 RepID=UPI004059D643
MFKFLKKDVNNNFYSPVDGKLINIKDVNDPVFNTKAMGEGFGIVPDSDDIYSPVSGEVTMIAKKSKHAIGIKMENGNEILVHMGIDTVKLNGKPFELFVDVGNKVKYGEKIAYINRNQVNNNNLEDTIVVVITENKNNLIFDTIERKVSKGDRIE